MFLNEDSISQLLITNSTPPESLLDKPHSWDVRKLRWGICCSVSQSVLGLKLCGLQCARLPVLHQLPEPAQTHAHWIGDAIRPSHPLSFRFPPAFSLSQHQGLFQWVGSSHQMAKGLELQLQHQSLQWIFRIDFLYDWLVWSPCSPRDSRESSPVPQFKSINSSVLSLLYGPTFIHTWLLEKP